MPQYIETIIGDNSILSFGLNLISVTTIVLYFLGNYKYFIKSDLTSGLLIILFLAEYGVFLGSTISNHGPLRPALSHSLNVLLLCLVVSLVTRNETDLYYFLRTVQLVTLTYCLLNIAVTMMMPDGIPNFTTNPSVPKYLYGNVNSTIRGLYPGICCSLIMDKRRKTRFSLPTILFFASLAYICVRIYFMATAVICSFILISWVALESIIKKHIRLVYFIVLALVVFFEITIVLQPINQSISMFVSQTFGKSLDFTGRRALWVRTLAQLPRHYVWGHGFLSADDLLFATGNRYGSHNYYMDLVFQRGIVGLTLMMIIWSLPVFHISRKEISSTIYIMIGLCCALFVMFLSEPFYSSELKIMPLFYATSLLVTKSENLTVDNSNTKGARE